MHSCPVCFFKNLPYPPVDFHICPCCGTEFDSDDVDRTHADLRSEWIRGGGIWFFKMPPRGWNPWRQLYRANVSTSTLPYDVRLSVAHAEETSTFQKTVVGLVEHQSVLG